MNKRSLFVLGAVLLAAGLIAPAATASTGSTKLSGHAAAVRYKRTHGYLPIQGPAGYARLKAEAERRASASTGSVQPEGPRDPITNLSWEGVSQGGITPPDSTGATGPNSYVEFVNLRYAIYDRTGGTIINGNAGQLTGFNDDGCLSDPQILWDTSQSRFYYVILNVCADEFDWGYSKTDNPLSGSTDFCHYVTALGYGSALPDYPKAGTTKNFLLIGSNVFNPGYVGSDVAWINKDAASATCPPSSSFRTGKFTKLKTAVGTLLSTPNPAVMTDVTTYGFVVGTPGGSGNFLSVYGLRPHPADPTRPQISKAHSVFVTGFGVPPSAKQCNTTKTLDTLDSRLEHAVFGQDPNHGNQLAIWTAHAVFGGGGAEERWYEINPLPINSPMLLQSGKATDPSLFVWNGAISPNRSVHEDGTAAFGGDMVMGFTTSSATQCTADQMVSKIGANAQSGFVLVKQSTVAETDFSCNETCRWGDYSGATPDPAMTSTGQVWLTNEFAGGSFIRTENWEATP